MGIGEPETPAAAGFQAALERAGRYGREVPVEDLSGSLEEAWVVVDEYQSRLGGALLSFLVESVTLAAMARLAADEPPLDHATVAGFFEQSMGFFNNFSDW
jgi:hypothetical protein